MWHRIIPFDATITSNLPSRHQRLCWTGQFSFSALQLSNCHPCKKFFNWSYFERKTVDYKSEKITSLWKFYYFTVSSLPLSNKKCWWLHWKFQANTLIMQDFSLVWSAGIFFVFWEYWMRCNLCQYHHGWCEAYEKVRSLITFISQVQIYSYLWNSFLKWHRLFFLLLITWFRFFFLVHNILLHDFSSSIFGTVWHSLVWWWLAKESIINSRGFLYRSWKDL